MNTKSVAIMKNLNYALSSNFLTLLISTIILLLVPKIIGVEEYGYWQLYIFYSSYVGFLHFGWNDGVYLRYGGYDYNKLNKNIFFSQFWMLVLVQSTIGFIIIVISLVFINDVNKQFIFQMTSFCMFIVNTKLMLIYILQSTNRIKEYAQITILEKFNYFIIVMLFLVVGIKDYKLLIAADLVGKTIALLYSIYFCREIVFNIIRNFRLDISEIMNNISAGIKLMFANIASMLIIGIVRLQIESNWNIVTFGKVSLTLSISSLMMLFINAIGIIIFPILRRTKKTNLPEIYKTLRTVLVILLFGILVIYYPLKSVLFQWLPAYSDSLIYMALLFPICVYEGKVGLLVNTYLKTLRKESVILRINLITVLMSIILTVITIQLFENLSLTILSILILLAFRSILAEIYLSKLLKISLNKEMLYDALLTTVFITASWFLESLSGIMIYLIAYIAYILLKKQDILISINTLKNAMRK